MQDKIKINDSGLDKIRIQELLQAQIAKMPTIPDLTQTGPKALHYTQQQSPQRTTDSIPDFSQAFIELINKATIQEPEFKSTVPIFGPLIVNFRQMWNWMSTRWYLLPIIRQQSDVNMQLAIMLMEMTQLQALNTRNIVDLQAKIQILEEDLLQQKE